MQLTDEDIKKVAVLARLQFIESEIALFGSQLGNIVTFVEQLGEVDTEGVEPMAHPLDIHSVLRDDILSSGLSREAALSNSPNQDDTYFLVPPVMPRKNS